MSVLGASFVVVGFAVLAQRLGLIAKSKEAIDHSRAAIDVLRDPNLDDDAKEKALQQRALRLMRLLAVLVAGSLAALLLPLGVIFLLDLGGQASLDGVLGVLQRIDFLVAATVVGTAVHFALQRVQR